MSDRKKGAADKQPGECIGQYQIIRLLGEGTFSKVSYPRKRQYFEFDKMYLRLAGRNNSAQVYLVEKESAAESEVKEQVGS